jgi:hypothetical protein
MLAYDTLSRSHDFSHQAIHFPPYAPSPTVRRGGTRSIESRNQLELSELIPKIDEVLDEIEHCIDILFPPMIDETLRGVDQSAEVVDASKLKDTIKGSGLGSHSYSIEVEVDLTSIESSENKYSPATLTNVESSLTP